MSEELEGDEPGESVEPPRDDAWTLLRPKLRFGPEGSQSASWLHSQSHSSRDEAWLHITKKSPLPLPSVASESTARSAAPATSGALAETAETGGNMGLEWNPQRLTECSQ